MQCHFEFQRRAVLASRLSAGRGKSGFYGARASCALVLEIKSAVALIKKYFLKNTEFHKTPKTAILKFSEKFLHEYLYCSQPEKIYSYHIRCPTVGIIWIHTKHMLQ